jgi:hypothetical protein
LNSHFVSEINSRIERKYSCKKKKEGRNSKIIPIPNIQENTIKTIIPISNKSMGNSTNVIIYRAVLWKALSLNLEQNHTESKVMGDVITAEKTK